MVNEKRIKLGNNKLELENKLIQYLDNLIDKNMEETSLSADKLELIIEYLKS